MTRVLRNIIILAVVGMASLWGANAHADIIPGLFNTGVQVSNGIDQQYTLIDPPAPYTSSAYVLPTGTWPLASGSGPWVDNSSASQWIVPALSYSDGLLTHTEDSIYIYQVSFNLAGFDPTTAQITGQWATDNEGLNIIINGDGLDTTNPGDFQFHPFTIDTGFMASEHVRFCGAKRGRKLR